MKTKRLFLYLFALIASTANIWAGLPAENAEGSLDIFSSDLQNPVPVRVYNNRDNNYAIKINAADSYTGHAVNSGVGTYEENEIWYLVGTAESFKMYNRTAGTSLALTLAGTGSGSAATLTATGTDLCLVQQSSGAYAICPTANTEQSFNMHGGKGNNIKLYGATDGGSTWLFKTIDTSKPLNLNYNAQLEGGYEQNYKIGELSISIDGITSNTMLTKTTVPASSTKYLPEGATFSIGKGFMCHGWTMDINGSSSIENQTLPEGGLTANVNIAVDADNIYQYLYYSPSAEGHPYRIPAIATTANGYVFAINDYRPCGNDIGYGEVDLVMRHSTAAGNEWDGHSWTDEIKIADGLGHINDGIWKMGYGDPAIVADRENNEILVMSVCGNRICWDGNYGSGTDENPENPNRISRLRIKFNDSTKEWEVSEPEEVTYDIYPLFKDSEGTVHSSSMFIGAGRIAQSSKIKVGTHFRIYCAVWVVTVSNRQHHNYALYSDDFGETWNLLGELGYDNSPAKRGNEPKCEELPDGSVLLSSRKGYGRYFNVFRYTDAEKGEGYWEGEVSTDAVGDLKWGANDTNGEPLRIGNVLFQSAPTGSGRSDVSVFYKVLSNDPADYTPTKLSSGWTEIEISSVGSAYSSMCILPDGENIGLFYEEEPGGYSMVYRPIILKDVLPAEVYEALSALPPTYASEASPVWHHVKFGATGNVLCDQGAGNNAATATAEETDACMWNIVGTKDGCYLVSKLGNYLSYDAKNNRYTTTADKSQKAALVLKENIKGSWEIMRKGASKSMSEVATKRSITGEVADATICGESNQIAFADLTPEVYDPAIFSTEEAPVWYQVQFKAGGCYIADQGDGNNLLTKASSTDDAQFWQFIGTPESFYMKSRSGNYVYYTNSRFATSSTEKTELFVISNATEGYYEIGRTTSSSNTFNQWAGTGADKELGEWTAGNTNNPLRFIEEEEEITIPYPKFSTEDAPTYYWVYLNTSSAALADKGANTNAATATKSYTDTQLWQLVGNESSFYMKNKAGRYLYYNSTAGRFQATETSDSKTTLELNYLSGENFEIKLYGQTGNVYMNPNGGAGTGKELGIWSSGDPNNPVSFITTEPAYPTFSEGDEEYWYFIKFGNGGWVIESKGTGNNVRTATLDDYDTQKWKLTGTKDNCQIINKEGDYLVYSNNKIQASNSADAQGFKLVATTNNNYPQQIEIQHLSITDKAFNMDGGAGSGKNIALYNSNDGGNPLTFVPVESIIYPEFEVATSSPAAPEEKLTLWYTQPAAASGVENTWMEYSLPIGNGQFGASLFGGVAKDQILFNDKTLWSGGPSEYGYYLPFGSIYIEDISGDFTYNPTKPIQNYYRDLNLKTATGTVTYENADGVKFTREYIASNPDKAVVTRITASEEGKINLRFTLESGKPTVDAETTYSAGYATFSGKLQTVSYNATMRIMAKGGFTSTGADGITVEEADEVLVILAGCTDFVGDDPSHINGRASQLPADNRAIVDAVAEKGWDAVYAAHVADHQEYFNRVTLELDGVENNLPTNELIKAYNAASGTRNLMLEQLYYNYGRYLSIASSRGVDLPNNLQGIWNNTCTPPWHSDIHANINVQMNYWPVSAGNLDEMYVPFLNYIINEAAQPEWKGMASNAVTKLNTALGTSTAVRDDSWTCYTENNIFGGYSTFMTNYVIANAWYVTHIWQHYRYTLDKEFLAKAFPAMKGSSLFWADRMVLAEDGTYECPNEYSPEHGPGSENGVAHAQQIAWESIDNTIKAADILGGVEAGIITQDDYDLLKDRLEKMDKGLATEEYTGKWGEGYGVATGDKILREWKYTSTFADNAGIERAHRHMSHLMALYPFGQLTPASEYFEPAINSMKLRGDESTGWSMGWKINLWARALMGDRSHGILRKALKHSTSYGTNQGAGGIYYNLYDSHAPFQIDGNFGACSGVNEMLLQSHTDVIDILPALPTEWSKGYVTGLKAVGDFTVSIKWEGNQARKVTITNNQGQPLYVKCEGLSAATVTVNGAAYTLGEAIKHNGLDCYQITSQAGDEVIIDLSNATQNDKSALEALIAETKELVNECYDYYATEAALQTTTVGEDYYVSTNAQEDSEGPIVNLVDGNNDTHFHSEYSTDQGANHYININLGAENATSSFKFKYATRKAATNFPKTIVVSGSTNGTDFETIETVTGLPVGNSSTSVIYTSGIIESATAYTQLRFTVTANNSGNNEAGGHPYFHMAEFDLMPRTDEPVENYPDAVNVPAAIAKANTEIEAATTALTATQTTVEYEASLAALQTAYDELVAAIESGSLPVLLTTDVNNPIVYKIGIKRGDTKVIQYDLASSNMVVVANYSEGNTLQGWYFTKGSADDKVFIHPYVGGGDVLGADNTSNGDAKVWAAVKGSTEHEEWKILLVSAEEGTYNIKAGDDSNYFSNIYGESYKIGFYGSANTTDPGSRFTFTRIDFDGGVWYNTLEAYKTNVCTIENFVDGTELGYYRNGAPYNTARAEAVAVLADEYASESNYKSAYTALRAAKEAIEFIAPQAGRYYRLKGKQSGKYIDASGTNGGKVNMSTDGTGAASIFYITEDGKLLSFYTGTCIKETYGIGASIADGNVVYFNPSESGNEGYFTLKTNYSGSKYIYDHGDNGYINRNGGYVATRCEWAVEEVTTLPVTVTDAGYATFYAPVEVTIPEEAKVYYAQEIRAEGYIHLEEVSDAIPAETGVIIEGAGNYSFTINYDGTTESIDDNKLHGTIENTLITKENGNAYYILGLNDEGEVGMYDPVNNTDENTFYNAGHKAYMIIEGATQTAGYSFNWGGTTGIEGIEDATDEPAEQTIFDLQGRKLDKITAPGIYIINGEKVFVK